MGGITGVCRSACVPAGNANEAVAHLLRVALKMGVLKSSQASARLKPVEMADFSGSRRSVVQSLSACRDVNPDRRIARGVAPPTSHLPLLAFPHRDNLRFAPKHSD